MNRILKGRNGSGVLRVVYGLGLALCATGGFGQGALTPPGPPGPNMKTLQQVEPRTPIGSAPYTIETPGSYYLTNNLIQISADPAINIKTSNVSLDLSGYTLFGIGNGLDGIFVSAGEHDILISNGIIIDFGGSGIDGSLGSRITATGIQVVNCGQFGAGSNGIYLGNDSIVERCEAFGNGSRGIELVLDGSISNCISSGNVSTGIYALSGASVIDCVAHGNGGAGITALSASSIAGCVSLENLATGIYAGSGSTVTGCAAVSNGSFGIWVEDGSTVVDCSSRMSGLEGFIIRYGSMAFRCSAQLNHFDGFEVNENSIVQDCLADTNAQSGSGAGFSVAGVRCRIEGNHSVGNVFGIDVLSARNIVIRNTCTMNTTNFRLVADNYYGAIINRVGVGTPAVLGNAAASVLATTDPWANFAY